MEKGAQGPDWDSDETVIEGSVTESDLEEEELLWRRCRRSRRVSVWPPGAGGGGGRRGQSLGPANPGRPWEAARPERQPCP